MTAMDARDIVFTRHDGRRGIAWLRDAYAMFSRARLPWLLLLLAYYASLALIDIVPYIGQLAVPVLKPVFAVGFLAAAWAQERGGLPRVAQLFQGFKSNLSALLPLGVFFLIGITVSILATQIVDDGRLLDVLSGREKLTEEMIRSGDLQLSMLFAAFCALPTILALWFAPGLVVFQDANAVTALSASLRAALANWRPLLVYGLGVFVLGGVVPYLILLAISQLLGNVDGALVLLVTLPYLMFFVATLHISDYVSYRDVFHAGETLAPLER
jgi:hypothetical protein